MKRKIDAPVRRTWLTPLKGCLALSLAVTVSACAPDNSDLEGYLSEIKARKSAPIEPIPEMKPFDTFSYPEEALRDPFAPLEIAAAPDPRSSADAPNLTRPRELLEEFPLDGLRMMGTLRQKGSLWALIRDPGGTVHRAQIGNYLGQNQGKIVYMDDFQVKLTELVPDGSGGWMRREAALAVQE